MAGFKKFESAGIEPGASWSDAAYRFPGPDAAQLWNRSETNGFRCLTYGSPPAPALLAPVKRVSRDYTKERASQRRDLPGLQELYSYQHTDLNRAVESVNDSAPHWLREKITFNAAYGDEPHLFLPRNAEPPYQTVIYLSAASPVKPGPVTSWSYDSWISFPGSEECPLPGLQGNA